MANKGGEMKPVEEFLLWSLSFFIIGMTVVFAFHFVPGACQ